MGVKIGNTNIVNIFHGVTPITNIFKGSDLIFQLGGDVYELIANVDVTTATTQIDFDNLNITKDDELTLICTFVGDSTTINFPNLFVNDINTKSNYTRQYLVGSESSFFIGRTNEPSITYFASNIKSLTNVKIKISNNDRFVYQENYIENMGSGSNNIVNGNNNVVLTSTTITTINKLSIVGSRTNGIAVGSRLQLYKVNKGSA